ncbi:AI-2E family transporter [Deinococcus yavapaiensis]|uniref:Putative PurR-regulated permease PerM n=1 Tax=Deinococcus yavapaiensis KR-236 TaxID=694435 RepID=A0A318SGD8_9DEIO|nr:AI-2E family transporter [Deinococcus yavapaiensis]PYE55956.1 putative PurR-regulated permease PerM [Deinococcus yavapaiensis KR-236]
MTRMQPESNAFAYVWRSPYVRVAVFLLLGYLAYRFVGSISSVISLALVAYVIAYLANPFLNWLQRRRVRRGFGIFLVFLVVAGFLVVASTLLFAIGGQLVEFVRQLPEIATNAANFATRLLERYDDNTYVQTLQEQLQNLSRNSTTLLQERALPLLQNLISPNGPLLGGLSAAANYLGNFVIVLILSIYMMADFDKIGLTLLRAFPRKWQPRVLELANNVETAVGGYLRGQLLIAAAVGFLVWLGLEIISLPQAAAIGFIAGVFNIVPYLGVIIAITPALLLAIPLGWLKMVLVVVVFVVANQIEGNFLSPFILGRSTNLHPVTVIIAILVGLGLFGIVGALVAVPLTALGKLLLQEYYFPSKIYKQGP